MTMAISSTFTPIIRILDLTGDYSDQEIQRILSQFRVPFNYMISGVCDKTEIILISKLLCYICVFLRNCFNGFFNVLR